VIEDLGARNRAIDLRLAGRGRLAGADENTISARLKIWAPAARPREKA